MRAIPLRLFSIVTLLIAASVALAGTPRVFEIPDHGALTLLLPSGWVAQVKQPPSRLPPTIGLKPDSGTAFEVLITAGWSIGEKGKVPDETSIRSEVAAAAKDASSQSMEGELSLREIKGTDGRGFYFVATDKAPNPGEYRYLTQGIIRVGGISLAFTVLTNDGQEPVLRAALDLLRTAVYRPSSAL